MPTGRIVPAFDKVEERERCFPMSLESITLPLGESKHSDFAIVATGAPAGMLIEPPSLILTKASFDERFDEEYYRRLEVFDGADQF